MKNLFLALSAAIFLFFISYQPKIIVSTEKNTLAVVDATKNLPLTINFIHSVQKTPVIENLEYENGKFILRKTIYQSQGVGLPFDICDGDFHRDGDKFIFENMNRHFDTLELRIGKGTHLKLTLGDKNLELYKKVPLGTKIIVKAI